MNIQDKKIDGGKAFDWGRTSLDYAKYRDVYPEIFYEKINARNLCVSGQKVLDLGTGTGVLPRNMYQYGAEWVGTDISGEQIAQARRLAQEGGQQITFLPVAAENLDFPEGTFDVITACQCFTYFDKEEVIRKLAKFLKPEGRLLVLYMSWLPFEDEIAAASEELVLKYNPVWTGAGRVRKPVSVSGHLYELFGEVYREDYDVEIPFTREGWHGRVKACRGVGASMTAEEVAAWEREHLALLEEIAPETFTVKHQVASLELKKKG